MTRAETGLRAQPAPPIEEMTTDIAAALAVAVALPAIVIHADPKVVTIITTIGVKRKIPVHNWMALVMQLQAIDPRFH